MKCRITMKQNQTWKISIKILLLSSLLHCYECGYKSKYKDALNKAKSYYKENFKKDKTWQFLGHDLTEFPGHNEKYRKVHQEKWNEYYKCLNIQNSALGMHGSLVPEAVQGFEGHLTSFDCKICLSPKERLNIDAVVWYWAPLESDNLVQVEYNEHILISPEDKTLTLYNLQVDQTGLYICKLGTALTAPYYLTVVNSTTNITEVHTEFAAEGPYPKKPQVIKAYNLVLDTVWGEWSSCSTCKNVGKRHKFGYCIVLVSTETYLFQDVGISSNSSNSNILPASENTTKIPVLNRMRRKNTKNHTENDTTKDIVRDLELVRIFENGIPCLSHILPESIKTLIQTENRSSEVLIGYCKMACPEETIFEVKDKQGNVIETANNSAGIYSMLQGIPQLEPPIKRMLQYEKTGENIVISCPGNLNSDTPIQWQLGSKKLIAELISQQSNKRIFISVSDKIHIHKAKVSDSNIYSCWQNNELAGTTRLVVEKQIKLSFNHHIMLFGMVVILATFLYIFAKAVFRRKYTKSAQ